MAKQRNAVGRTQAYNAARAQARDLFSAEQTSGSDFSNPDNVDQFQAALKQNIEQAVQQHADEYGSDSAAVLSQALEQEKQSFLDRGAARGLAANQAMAQSAIGEEIVKFSNAVANDPSSLQDQMVNMEGHLMSFYGDLLEPAEMDAQLKAARGEVVTTAINSMLSQPGGLESAALLMQDPVAMNALTPAQRINTRKNIIEARRELTSASREGRAIRQKLAGALGIPESEISQEQVMSFLKKGGGTTVTIGAEGKGKEAFAKATAEADVKRIASQVGAATQATKDKVEIARMRAALDAGDFKTGAFAQQRQFVARLANFLGLDEDNPVLEEIGNARTSDTLDAAVNKMAINEAANLGRITNMSLGFVKDSLPSLTRTPEGNRILIDVMDRSADRQILLGKVAEEYQRNFGSLNPTDDVWKERYPNIPRMSFSEAAANIEAKDPVVNEEMINKIKSHVKTAPKTFKAASEKAVPTGLPKGSVYAGKSKRTGKPVYRAPDGKLIPVN
jgi:hypothetical protein